MKKDSFVFYISQYEAIKELENEQLGRLFRAIFEKQLEKEVVLENDIKIAFNFINNQMVVDNEKYLKKCETLKNNAKKGGAPKGNQNAKKQKQPNREKNNLNDNDNDNVNDIKTIINNYFNKKELKEKVFEHLEIRKKLKAQNTVRAIKLLLKDLDGKNELEQSLMIDKAIKNSWKSYYELSDKEKREINNNIPEWFNQNIEATVDLKKQNEMEELLKEFN